MPSAERTTASSVSIPVGGDEMCLGFANTRYWRGSPTPTETLTGLADLVSWLTQAGVSPTAAMAQRACDDPERVAAIFADAIALREMIYRVFGAVAVDEPVAAEDLAALNHALASAPRRRQLVHGPAGFVWAAEDDSASMPLLLAPVIWSAADLLTHAADGRRIRRCANDQCLWLFLDQSKTGTRRWCDMAACGNRAKSRRHYLKAKRS